MEKSKVASPRKVSRRNRKSVKKPKVEPTPEITTREEPSLVIVQTDPVPLNFKGSIQALWINRPQLNKVSPSAAEVEKFKEDYKLWQLQMDKLLQ